MPYAALIPVVYLLAVTPALVMVDLREHRLPNRIVVPGVVVGLIAAAMQGSLIPLLAGAGYAGVLGLLALTGGIGMGDVKLAALIGLAAGAHTPGAAAGAFLLGGAAASVALIRRGPRTRIPFGPAMLAGYWVAVLVAATDGISP